MWWILGIFVALGLFILVAFEWRERQRNVKHELKEEHTQQLTTSDGECCGQHAVCERDTLLNSRMEVVYYDDEELDVLAGMSPDDYTEEQLQALRDVFYTLQERDVAGWLRSLQARNILLPLDLREEALLIVSERRNR
ncbi:MAG: phospholipase [Paludibacter sp.]|nr:phospholipase [Bacteroidales bacterium]MCM1068564.1 phospholipase [Prevotella sp.]MCM1353228.1 phospholipase [Bacteroides sp.]MCM1442364.1 phospholipase [Muribaculum sp.]MCM1481183.1 phospholipase [Paludibacter sp.]